MSWVLSHDCRLYKFDLGLVIEFKWLRNVDPRIERWELLGRLLGQQVPLSAWSLIVESSTALFYIDVGLSCYRVASLTIRNLVTIWIDTVGNHLHVRSCGIRRLIFDFTECRGASTWAFNVIQLLLEDLLTARVHCFDLKRSQLICLGLLFLEVFVRLWISLHTSSLTLLFNWTHSPNDFYRISDLEFVCSGHICKLLPEISYQFDWVFVFR